MGNMHKELIKISEKDLQAAKLLHRNKLYAQSVFYFQQSVEKSNKAWGLISGKVKQEDLPKKEKIGHNVINIHKENVRETLEGFIKFKQLLKDYPKLKTVDSIFQNTEVSRDIQDMEHVITTIKKIEKDKKSIIHLSSGEILFAIKEIKKSFNDAEKLKKSKIYIKKKDLREMQEYMVKTFSVFESKLPPQQFKKLMSGLRDFFEKLTKKDMEQVLRIWAKGVYLIMPIHIASFYLSIIILPHAVLPRYPLGGMNPLEIYNRKLPLVKLLRRLMNIQEKVIKRLKLLQKTEYKK